MKKQYNSDYIIDWPRVDYRGGLQPPLVNLDVLTSSPTNEMYNTLLVEIYGNNDKLIESYGQSGDIKSVSPALSAPKMHLIVEV